MQVPQISCPKRHMTLLDAYLSKDAVKTDGDGEPRINF